MPLDPCNPCACNADELARSAESYKAAHLRILCQILQALDGGSGSDPSIGDYTLTRPPISAVSGVIIAANPARRWVELANNTDVMIWINFDAPAVAGQGLPLDPGSHKIFRTTQEIRGVTAVANVNIECMEVV